MKARTKTIIIVALLLAAWGAGVLTAKSKLRAEILEQQKLTEASQAKVLGLNAAVEVGQREMANIVSDNGHLSADNGQLNATVATLTSQLDAIGVVDPEIREVVRWQTETIEVPVDRLVEVPTDCELPTVTFSVSGSEVRVSTSLGNTFATGTVALIKESPLPRIVLGSAPWRAELTEFTKAKTKKVKLFRWTLAVVGVYSDSGATGYGVRASRHFGGRLAIVAGATSLGPSEGVCCPDWPMSVSVSGQTMVEGGLSWSW